VEMRVAKRKRLSRKDSQSPHVGTAFRLTICAFVDERIQLSLHAVGRGLRVSPYPPSVTIWAASGHLTHLIQYFVAVPRRSVRRVEVARDWIVRLSWIKAQVGALQRGPRPGPAFRHCK